MTVGDHRGRHIPHQQLDLFAGSGRPVARPEVGERTPLAWHMADDDTAIAAIADAGLIDAPAAIAEAGRRRLARAIPVIEAVCRRFSGFGVERMMPEQSAAFDALAAIGGIDAAQTVARLIAQRAVQGPTLRIAAAAAAGLDASLPADTVVQLLRHDDADIRANACRCARRWPAAVPLLIDLLDDLQPQVGIAAACALGHLGRTEARPILLRVLQNQPRQEIIEAMVPVADEDCVGLLGRIARLAPDLAGAILDALDSIDCPRARAVARSLRIPGDPGCIDEASR